MIGAPEAPIRLVEPFGWHLRHGGEGQLPVGNRLVTTPVDRGLRNQAASAAGCASAPGRRLAILPLASHVTAFLSSALPSNMTGVTSGFIACEKVSFELAAERHRLLSVGQGLVVERCRGDTRCGLGLEAHGVGYRAESGRLMDVFELEPVGRIWLEPGFYLDCPGITRNHRGGRQRGDPESRLDRGGVDVLVETRSTVAERTTVSLPSPTLADTVRGSVSIFRTSATTTGNRMMGRIHQRRRSMDPKVRRGVVDADIRISSQGPAAQTSAAGARCQ